MPTIESITAFVATDENGEGIIGFRDPSGYWMPMIAADMDRLKALLPAAVELFQNQGVNFRIIRFTVKEDITEQFLADIAAIQNKISMDSLQAFMKAKGDNFPKA